MANSKTCTVVQLAHKSYFGGVRVSRTAFDGVSLRVAQADLNAMRRMSEEELGTSWIEVWVGVLVPYLGFGHRVYPIQPSDPRLLQVIVTNNLTREGFTEVYWEDS